MFKRFWLASCSLSLLMGFSPPNSWAMDPPEADGWVSPSTAPSSKLDPEVQAFLDLDDKAFPASLEVKVRRFLARPEGGWQLVSAMLAVKKGVPMDLRYAAALQVGGDNLTEAFLIPNAKDKTLHPEHRLFALERIPDFSDNDKLARILTCLDLIHDKTEGLVFRLDVAKFYAQKCRSHDPLEDLLKECFPADGKPMRGFLMYIREIIKGAKELPIPNKTRTHILKRIVALPYLSDDVRLKAILGLREGPEQDDYLLDLTAKTDASMDQRVNFLNHITHKHDEKLALLELWLNDASLSKKDQEIVQGTLHAITHPYKTREISPLDALLVKVKRAQSSEEIISEVYERGVDLTDFLGAVVDLPDTPLKEELITTLTTLILG